MLNSFQHPIGILKSPSIGGIHDAVVTHSSQTASGQVQGDIKYVSMAEFRKIATKEEIPMGKIKAFRVSGIAISIANSDGEYFAFDDTCTHEECSLSEGYLDGYSLTCFCHAGQFDISTGEVLSPPPPAPIGVYKVKVEGEDILIEI